MVTEIEILLKHIEKGFNFLLSGGAGSGKTYTLIELLNAIYTEKPKSSIACITYTNVAADEIKERTTFENLYVSTIHDFLWLNISSYQINLKELLVELNPDLEIDINEIESVDYREYRSLKKGVISHDEVIKLSENLFRRYPLLPKIIHDRYDFILVDEYQDTFREVTEILFRHLNREKTNLTIGLFGDSMQSIFNKGVGDINEYINSKDEGILKIIEVPKKVNRRNPLTVIDLANKIRTDGLKQEPLKNTGAPNNLDTGAIRMGKSLFAYSKSGNKTINDLKEIQFFDDWDFKDHKITKELYLSHSLIAHKAGFGNLMDIYTKDKLVGRSGSFLLRLKDISKIVFPGEKFSNLTVLEVVNKLIKTIDAELDYESGQKLLLDKLKIVDTYRKAQNALDKDYAKLSKFLPTEVQYNFISDNSLLFDVVKKSLFEDIRKIYLDRSKLIGKKKSTNEESNRRVDERDRLVRHLLKIQDMLFFFEEKRYPELIKAVDFSIDFGRDKSELKMKIEELYAMRNKTIGEVMDKADELGLLLIDESVRNFIDERTYLYERVKKVIFKEIKNLYNYVEGYTVYSTQQGIKGTEFKNVLVSLDKKGHPDFNYRHLFEDAEGKEKLISSSQKLFYVCCTRAMENLAVFYNEDYSEKAIKKAILWFGQNSVLDLDTI